MSAPSPAWLEVAPGAALRQHGLRPKKSWGQNFLTDPQVHRAVVAAAQLGDGAVVVELGAGLGALTAHLLAAPQVGRVIAIERDPDLLPVLQQRFAGVAALQVRAADAGHLDWQALHREHGRVAVVGNLPYHLACRIAVDLAGVAHLLQGVGLLVQREVAQRMAAPPGNRRGLLTVLVQRAFEVRLCREVAAHAFVPPPKVQSTVVALQPRSVAAPSAAGEAAGRWVARAAFAGRRKTLQNSLQRGGIADKAALTAVLQRLDLAAARRPESLFTEQFFALGAALQQEQLLPAGWEAA